MLESFIIKVKVENIEVQDKENNLAINICVCELGQSFTEEGS